LGHLERTYKQKPTDGLWISATDGKQLTQHGLRQILRRRAKDAGVEEFGPHSFRRAFARNAWLQGMDIISIQRLLGHSNLAVINRYIKSYNDDLRVVHEKHSPVDSL
jgi:integrase/recombinase XerD